MPALRKTFSTDVNALLRFGGTLRPIHYGISNTRLRNGETNNNNKRNVGAYSQYM